MGRSLLHYINYAIFNSLEFKTNEYVSASLTRLLQKYRVQIEKRNKVENQRQRKSRVKFVTQFAGWVPNLEGGNYINTESYLCESPFSMKQIKKKQP